jgi:hypothetical protein
VLDAAPGGAACRRRSQVRALSAERVMCERKLEVSDTTPLRNSVVFKIVQSLRHAERRMLVAMVEKRKGICVWSAADVIMLTRCQ